MAVIATDIPGSSLTIAYTNYLQDGATRRFMTNSLSRRLAINEVKQALIDETGAISGGYNHPDADAFESVLAVNRISATAAGPDRWVVTVEYTATKYAGFPGTSATTLMNARVSHESVQVYCKPTHFQNGLPFGGNGTDFVTPGGPNGRSTDPKDKPVPYIWSRPICVLQIPFSTTTNPFADGSIANTGKTLPATRLGNINFNAGELRFDGADITSSVNSGGGLGSLTFSGVQHYSASLDGFYIQALKWGHQGWECENQPAYANQ